MHLVNLTKEGHGYAPTCERGKLGLISVLQVCTCTGAHCTGVHLYRCATNVLQVADEMCYPCTTQYVLHVKVCLSFAFAFCCFNFVLRQTGKNLKRFLALVLDDDYFDEGARALW